MLVLRPRTQAEFYASPMRLLTFNDTALKNKTKVVSVICVGVHPAKSRCRLVYKMLGEKGQVEKRTQGSVSLHQ